MWVLLLLGLLPLAVLPTMLGNGPQDGDAAGDDDDGDAGQAGDVWPDDALQDDGWWNGEGPPVAADAQHTADVAMADPDGPEDGAEDPPPFQPATFVLAPGDGVATFAGFQPGADRVEVHVDPEGPPPEMTSGQDDGGSWVRVTQGEAVAEARFPDLAEPPTDDIHLVAEPLEPDLSDDTAGNGGSDGGSDGGGDAALSPVTDDADAPGAAADDDGPALQPVVPPEEVA